MAGAVDHLEIDMRVANWPKYLRHAGAVERYPAVE